MTHHIQTTITKYLANFPEEVGRFEILQKQLADGEDIVSRKNFHGHVTASGLVLSPDNKVLLIFHNKLKRYLQPGGHIEAVDETLVDAARREVVEETGLQNIMLHPWHLEMGIPLNIDTHAIPANPNKDEDDHFHHDCMYVFYADEEVVMLDTTEVSDFKWVDVNDLPEGDSSLAVSVMKMMALK